MRHRIVHETGALQLTGFGVVGHPLHQRLADALHRAAVDLAFDDGGADDAADVVDRGIGHHRHLAGGRVELNLADMAAVGPGRAAGGGGVGGGDAATRLARGQLEQADAQIGAGDLEAAFAVFDVGGRRFQCLGGQALGVFHRLLRCHADGRATGEQRA